MKRTAFVITFIIFLIFPRVANAQLVINEFSSSGSDDWVEVYLQSEATESAQLSNYRLRDNTENNKLDLNGELSPGSYKAFDFGNKLNNTGDNITLRKLEGDTETVIDQISYGDKGVLCAPGDGKSIGRKPDGNGSFVVLDSQTKGSANSEDVFTCPTPTPSPTTSPTPTASPTPTPSPSPSASSSPKPTPSERVSASMGAPKSPTPRPSARSTATPGLNLDNESINQLGEATSAPKILGTLTDESQQSANAKTPTPALFLIGSGVAAVAIAGVSLWREKYNNKGLHE